jgi:hypothetical protein
MKEIKRVLSLVLCFVMLVGLVPAFAVNASAAGETGDAASTDSTAPDEVVTVESTEDSGESDALASGEILSGDDLIAVYAEGAEESLTAPGKGQGTVITKKTIYKLVSGLTDGGEYLIVNSNSAGSNNTCTHNPSYNAGSFTCTDHRNGWRRSC